MATTGVINIHAYGDSGEAQLEMPRLLPYLSNGVFVVSERGVEAEQEAKISNALVFVPKEQSRVWRMTTAYCRVIPPPPANTPVLMLSTTSVRPRLSLSFPQHPSLGVARRATAGTVLLLLLSCVCSCRRRSCGSTWAPAPQPLLRGPAAAAAAALHLPAVGSDFSSCPSISSLSHSASLAGA